MKNKTISIVAIWNRIKKNKNQIKQTIDEAIIGFVLWTLFLTPYVYPFVCKFNIDAYTNWLVMEALLVPPIAVVVVKTTNYLTRSKTKYER